MLASQVYRNGLEQIDPTTRTMRIVRRRRFWAVPHLALGAFIAALWLFDFALDAWSWL